MLRPHTGLISPVSKKGFCQLPESSDKSLEIDPSVVLRHPSTGSTSPTTPPLNRPLPLFKPSSPRESEGKFKYDMRKTLKIN